VEGIRIDLDDDGLVRLGATYLIDRADVPTVTKFEPFYQT
jgi:hypothetical protein